MTYQPFISFEPPALQPKISHQDPLFLLGSCFSENMATRLSQAKFPLCTNPHGNLFGPESLTMALNRYINPKPYVMGDLFCRNEVWHSWDHHSRFSQTNPQIALKEINDSLGQARRFIRGTRWIILTLGTAFQYYLKENRYPVSNNHRCPGSWFERRLMGISQIIDLFGTAIQNIQAIHPEVQIIFTVSPVRHIREGVQENNRSKARLLESVHSLCESLPQVQYFPAYEWQIDVLRDYRYYDLDQVHPNYEASEFIWERFQEWSMDSKTMNIMEEITEITRALKHRPRFPQTQAHRHFCLQNIEKIQSCRKRYPYLDLKEEEAYFQDQLLSFPGMDP